jgi:hypothetical protein
VLVDIILGALDARLHPQVPERNAGVCEKRGHLSMTELGSKAVEQHIERLRSIRCSFCGKSGEQARRLIAGPNGVFICNECVALCNEILAEGEQRPEPA